MVKVYFEYSKHTDLVATFENDYLYMLCLPALEKEAKKRNAKISESLEN